MGFVDASLLGEDAPQTKALVNQVYTNDDGTVDAHCGYFFPWCPFAALPLFVQP